MQIVLIPDSFCYLTLHWYRLRSNFLFLIVFSLTCLNLLLHAAFWAESSWQESSVCAQALGLWLWPKLTRALQVLQPGPRCLQGFHSVALCSADPAREAPQCIAGNSVPPSDAVLKHLPWTMSPAASTRLLAVCIWGCCCQQASSALPSAWLLVCVITCRLRSWSSSKIYWSEAHMQPQVILISSQG